MPLNLLQHKSWHVGSAKNQERVRRDEKEAQLREEEEERRMQLADADRRLAILRQRMNSGQTSEDVSLQVDHDEFAAITTGSTESRDNATTTGSTEWGRRERGTKRRRDEEVTRRDRDATARHTSNAPLMGPDGHINLFPPETKKPESKNTEYMADKKRKEDELEAQYTMKLSRPSEPWYSTVDRVSEAERSKDDSRRKREERVESRVREEQDPLKAMGFGLQKLRESRREAETERRKRDRDVGIGVGFGLERRYHSNNNKHDNNNSNNSNNKRRERHRGGRSDRSRSPRREKDKKDKDKDKDTSVQVQKLREERRRRETAERKKAETLIEDEMAARRPDRWTASAAGGKGKYSKQFGE
ncbi:hypothetical protein TWF281_004316 [Arthrobotrys megalospora]